MAEIINMPRLSDTMEEGVVSKWLKKVGDPIKQGDILAEIETDKATMEFESFYSGMLLHIALPEGQTAPVDSLLAIIGAQGEDISKYLNNTPTAPAVAAKPETPAETKHQPNQEAVSVPKGVEIINMPRLSDTMTEGTVAKWLKKVGDTVKQGDILAEIETDKATMEFESFSSGTILYIGTAEGQSAPVDTLLAIIGEKGTDVSAFVNSLQKGAASPEKVAPKAEAAPAVAEKTISSPVVSATALPSPLSEGGRVHVSPLAKKVAAEKGIPLNLLKGSGENGRIIKRDVENYSPAPAAASLPSFVASGAGTISVEEIPNSQMRKTIAKRLLESKNNAPHYYLMTEIDMTNAIGFRTQINALEKGKISFNDLIIKASALALRENPKVNSSWGDAAVKIYHHINIGVAVAVEDGLVVPVLNFADQMSLFQIGAQAKDLAAKARDKKLTPEQMSGSTFTVSNLGMFGIEEFTSIINQPNSAILSVGAIVEKPVVKNGQIAVGNTMKVTLACDHRTVDGATGAQFLKTLKQYIESPMSLVV